MPDKTKKIKGEITISAPKIINLKEWEGIIKESFAKDITTVCESIFGGAISLSATDIHLEPREKDVLLRTRIDGIMQEVTKIEKKQYKEINSRIKILSDLKLNVTDRPQDGRLTIKTEGREIEARVSSLPSEWGESIVVRILDPKNLKNLEELGLRDDLLKIFKKEIKRPYGMILVVGPTGSGKTTTLYAFLNAIKSPEVKIITIEDPIEYHLEGILQTQVDPKKGYDFANGLRAIVRQDPDVILVGEIRDSETADIAIQAALTGHLVFSTLHTDNAAGTIVRLLNLGAKPFHIAPAINLIVAQRLARRVCQKCKTLKKIDEKLKAKLKKALEKVPESVKIPPLVEIPIAKGCAECNFTGYKGLIGIFEALIVDQEMEEFILTSPSISALEKKAIEKGMVPMLQDGIIKVLEGITTLEELERVIGPLI